MSLVVFTIVLDGMPWLPSIYTTLCSLNLDWRWIVVEGTSKNIYCSSHCNEIEPRYSKDGTSHFLSTIKSNPRVTVLRQKSWDGKLSMCNAALELIESPCLLMQIDSDESWRPDQIEKLYALHEDWETGTYAKFRCRYFLGPNILSTGVDCYGNYNHEWVRAWSYQKGMRFSFHAPPKLEGADIIVQDFTSDYSLIFNHYAYVIPEQVKFKCGFYKDNGGDAGFERWKKLQENSSWPVSLKQFMPWVDDKAMADKSW